MSAYIVVAPVRYSLLCFWLVCLWLSAGAETLWDYLQQARPELARQRLRSFTPLQRAQLAYAAGETGEAWRLIRQLEKSYQPGQQPPEFFWVRAQLLRNDQWELAEKNLRGLLELKCSRELRLGALSLLAQGAAEQHQEAQSQQYWADATQQASLLQDHEVAALIRLGLIQANLHLQANRPNQALAGLLTTRTLATRSHFPALACLADLKLAETDMELADWQAFPTHCLRSLEQARACPEPWLVEKICTFWVDQQLARRSEPRAVGHCVTSLEAAQEWFQGEARLAVTRQLARAYSLGLNERVKGLRLLDSALRQCKQPRLRVRILAERFSQISPGDKLARRTALLELNGALQKLGDLQPEDPILRTLPRHGGLAALAETYLPDDPGKAEETFRKAETAAATPARRLEVVNYELTRYTAVQAMPLARKTLTRLLEMLKAAPLDQETSRIVRSQMFALRSEASQFKRLLLVDDIRPAPESPSTIVLTQLLREQALQSRLERNIYDRIRLAQNYKESCEAYQARAELLLAQGRWGEAILALERVQQSAKVGGWPLRQALAQRMMADAFWTMGRARLAIEAEKTAEQLFAASPNARDQRSAQDCRLLRAYFLLRSNQAQDALLLCQHSGSPWFSFLEGRCYLALNQPAQAEKAFLAARFDEELPEIGRLVYLARCGSRSDEYYREAYERARRSGSLAVREVCLDWAGWLRQQHQEERASQLEREAAGLVTAMLQEYPAEVRERLLDEPHTQVLLKSNRPALVNATVSESPRESRRTFLAKLNDVRERYPDLDSTLAVPPGDLAALQEQLPKNRVLVQYYAADTDLYAMRVDSSSCRLIQVAVEKKVLQQWVEDLRRALIRGNEVPELPARRLHAILVGALGSDLDGKQIQVVPNGFFWYLPWDVLKDPQGRFLVESQEWSCVSPAELLRAGIGSEKAGQTLERVVALGGTSANLPATGQEASAVAALFPHGVALIGPQARASELVRLAPRAQVLHVAAHSGLSPELNQTYIELSDGRFSLEQIYGLQLERGARVVLSSCESGLGQAAPGREVASLASAFLSSGASSVVATLWRVEDGPSAAFFQKFYPHLLKNESISTSLRQARLECLNDPELKEPRNWGAYQLIGDPG
ncbi:MAG: CHAT domain-containing protein [Candidatus Eremiobacteraeota bacterium]|nr:CHAT domain-containing protein [Candidatus Eremiobacteraeota bacterium]MCW5870140.1 CHAT domain-containing protein [Candidatus Eremiobacteraeota bacterium]